MSFLDILRLLHRHSGLLLLLSNLLIPIAIAVFAIGFFPYKPFIPGFASTVEEDSALVKHAPFDKVIFMVVDALRSDFVYSSPSGFNFTQELIRNGAAMPYTAHATSPTITMPRVKAMTTGSIPSFLDVILNFAESDQSSSLASQDTWPAQLARKPNGKLVMYGDDTWLKLFPGTFSRADGTSSFFVSDFTEVDNNVTRHVPSELERPDWNGMIMHYLGLDHIGHKSGPLSPHMIPKQHEMDGIVKQIYEALETRSHLQSTLLILCGDHGMNEAGNHGGSAAGETSPALVFIAPKLQQISAGTPCPDTPPKEGYQHYHVVEQSDIVPTLAGLLGFPVPLNNLGVFIPEFLKFWPQSKQRLQLLENNARQMMSIVNATFDGTSFHEAPDPVACLKPATDLDELRCTWAQSQNQDVDTVQTASLLKFLRTAQSIMSTTASNYDTTKLNAGILFATLATILALLASTTVYIVQTRRMLIPSAIILAYGGIMFASSYVEEEQHFWYWIASGWLAILSIKSLSNSSKTAPTHALLLTLTLALLRLSRRWSQTGNKHLGAPDISRTFLPAHPQVLWVLVTATYVDLFRRIATTGIPGAPRQVSTVAAFAACLAAFTFKVAFTQADAPELLPAFRDFLVRSMADAPLAVQARTVFLSVGLLAGSVLYQRFVVGVAQTHQRLAGALALHDVLTLFLVTQSRLANVPLFLAFGLQLQVLLGLDLHPSDATLTALLLQSASFFALGGSNAISSVDLSNAYNGIGGYRVGAVAALTFVSNWAGPLWWASAASLLILQQPGLVRATILQRHVALCTLMASAHLVFVMAACTMLRAHLFIWTVFSPKFLYSMAWSLGQHLVVNVGFTSLMVFLGS